MDALASTYSSQITAFQSEYENYDQSYQIGGLYCLAHFLCSNCSRSSNTFRHDTATVDALKKELCQCLNRFDMRVSSKEGLGSAQEERRAESGHSLTASPSPTETIC